MVNATYRASLSCEENILNESYNFYLMDEMLNMLWEGKVNDLKRTFRKMSNLTAYYMNQLDESVVWEMRHNMSPKRGSVRSAAWLYGRCRLPKRRRWWW